MGEAWREQKDIAAGKTAAGNKGVTTRGGQRKQGGHVSRHAGKRAQSMQESRKAELLCQQQGLFPALFSA